MKLPETTDDSTGVIYKGPYPFLHDYGTRNVFLGQNAGNFLMTGSNNIGIGPLSLSANSSGMSNVGIGRNALFSNTSGSYNFGLGEGSLFSNTTGNYNLGIGLYSLTNQLQSNSNIGIGYYSLSGLTYGSENTAIGNHALEGLTTGQNNIGIGNNAGLINNGNSNIFIGNSAGKFETGNNSIMFDNHGDTRTNESNARNNSIFYATGSGASDNMITFNGRVGIGTISPSVQFEVAGNARVGGTLNVADKLTTMASSTSNSGIILPHGTAPLSPVNGDLWTTTSGLYGQINGTTIGPFENQQNKATNPTLGASDIYYPSQNAVKTYVDNGLSGKQNTLITGTLTSTSPLVADAIRSVIGGSLTLSMPAASGSVDGYLTKDNWTTFNGKADASQTMYIGTTAEAINRASGSQTLNGVSIDGNAATVTNGVYTTSSYTDPSWITSLAGSKVSGDIGGNAGGLTAQFIDWNATSGGSSIKNKPTLTSGTVTSVATGYGVLGGPITSTGTILADTGAVDGLVSKVRFGHPTAFPTLNQNTEGTAGNVTGTVAIANGGTGQTSKSAAFDALSPMSAPGDMIYGGTSGTGTRLVAGSEGQLLTFTSGVPFWTPPGSISVGNATNFTGSLSGDVTGTQSATTVAKINGVTLGSTAATDKNILIANGTTWCSQPMSGDITIDNSGGTTIGSNKVTYTKMQTVGSTSKLLGSSATSNSVQEIGLGSGLNITGTTLNATGVSPDGSSLLSGKIWLGNSSNVAAPVTPSGDVTIDNTGVTSIGAGKVTNSMLAGSIDLTSKVANILPVANGGTGVSSFGSTNRILYTPTTNTLSWTNTASNGVLVTDGTGIPSIGSTLPSAVQDNITRLGNITSGIWSGTAIGVTKGGTGLTGVSLGDLLYGSATNTLATLPIVVSPTRYLSNTGSSNIPAWAQVDLTTGVTGTLPIGNGGSGVAILGNATAGSSKINIGGATSGQVIKSFSVDVIEANLTLSNMGGTLGVGHGGTGLTSGTSGGILGFTASGNLASSPTLTTNALLIGGGTGATPSTLSLGSLNTVVHGNGTSAPYFGQIVNNDISNSTIDLTSKVTGILPLSNGGTGVPSTTANGIILGGTTSTGPFQNAGAGTSGQVLTSNGPSLTPGWSSPGSLTIGSATNLAGGTAMSVPYQSAPNTTAFLSAGTSGSLLTTFSTGTPPGWVAPSTLSVNTATNLSGGSAGTVPYQTGPAATSMIAAGIPSTVLHGGTTPSFGSVVNSDIANSTIDLTTKVTGTLPVGNGGTGATTFTQHGVLIGESTTPVTALAPGTTGYVLTSTTASDPGWTSPGLLSVGTATNAVNTGITDDASTNATMYPTWVTAISGSFPQKTSSSKLTFNPSSGTLTATTFSGPLIGNVTGNVSGTAANVTGTVAIANGGTGQTTKSAAFDALSPMTTTGDIIYYSTSGTGTRLGIGSTGQFLSIGGGIPGWANLPVTDVNAYSPLNSDHASPVPNISLTGIVAATNGGTGYGTYTTGDLLTASSPSSLTRINDIATGNALISGGVNVQPQWGKIGLTTHVNGTLQVLNGGTGATTFTAGYLKASGTSAFTTVTSIPGSDISGDISGNAANVNGTVAVAHGGTGITSVGTAGTLAYSNGSTYAFSNTNLFWDNSNSRLGIGTGSSPLYPLHVSGSISTPVVYAVNSYSTGTGIVGIGNGATPSLNGSGAGGQFFGNQFGLYARATSSSANPRAGGYFTMGGTYAYVATSTTAGPSPYLYRVWGSDPCNGVTNKANGHKGSSFSIESPEFIMTDYGTGQLVAGKCHITLDPDLSVNIISTVDHPMKVFIQLEGDCKGVYVTNKSITGFDVIELQSGTSNVSFSYSITANRRDRTDSSGNVVSKYVGVRFPDAPKQQDN
ncbi:MAG: hypothetical protein NTX61_07180 [Bacteroidetes bacterium]|nr:hypothetical protein [Bacteroidota bacterium]